MRWDFTALIALLQPQHADEESTSMNIGGEALLRTKFEDSCSTGGRNIWKRNIGGETLLRTKFEDSCSTDRRKEHLEDVRWMCPKRTLQNRVKKNLEYWWGNFVKNQI